MSEDTNGINMDGGVSDANKFDLINDKETSKTYQLKKVNQLHREIIRLIVLGYKDKEIGTMLGCSPVTVRYVKESDIVQNHLNRLHDDRDEDATDLTKTIKRFAPLALEVATSIMNDDDVNANTRLSAATDIMDRAGYKPVDVKANLGDGKTTKSQIEEIKERAKRAGVMFPEQIENASFEEVSGKNGSNEADETNEGNE